VVTVHGNQECNALATILWDNAFAEPVSFVVLAVFRQAALFGLTETYYSTNY